MDEYVRERGCRVPHVSTLFERGEYASNELVGLGRIVVRNNLSVLVQILVRVSRGVVRLIVDQQERNAGDFLSERKAGINLAAYRKRPVQKVFKDTDVFLHDEKDRILPSRNYLRRLRSSSPEVTGVAAARTTPTRVEELEAVLQEASYAIHRQHEHSMVSLGSPFESCVAIECVRYRRALASSPENEETVTISLGLDPDDGWSVIPEERQAAIIEDLRRYARRRIEAISTPRPPMPTVSETIEQHRGPWFNEIVEASSAPPPDLPTVSETVEQHKGP